MAKKEIEVDRTQIVVEYYRAKWGIEDQNVVKFQVYESGEKIVVMIETSGVNRFSNKSKLNKRNVSSPKEKSEQVEVLKKRVIWWSLIYFLKEFFGKSIKPGLPNNPDF